MAARHDTSPDALIAARQREAAKPGRQKPSGRGSGLTPKVRKAIEILISADDLNPKNMNDDAAERAGISGRALKAALQKPSVRRFMNEQIEIYREGLKAVAVRTIGEIMTDPLLKTTASGARVRLEAAKTSLEEKSGSATNLHVNTQINVTPGYVIDLRRDKNSVETHDGRDRAALCNVRYSQSEVIDPVADKDPIIVGEDNKS
jgi:hypothetical protein